MVKPCILVTKRCRVTHRKADNDRIEGWRPATVYVIGRDRPLTIMSGTDFNPTYAKSLHKNCKPLTRKK